MANLTFNIAHGQVKQYFINVDTGAPANSRIIVVPIETTGLEADATIRDHNDLSALLAGTSNEQTTMGRKTVAAADITVTVDDTNERLDIDIADIIWTAATGNAISALVFCYDPDNTVGTDADLIPLLKADFVVTPDGSDIQATINAAGLFRASN
jgi:hypothetical protein